jgi:hypothetical protein
MAGCYVRLLNYMCTVQMLMRPLFSTARALFLSAVRFVFLQNYPVYLYSYFSIQINLPHYDL